jgi:8-oxo-dGTP pyrophosphatase MutT (NUDIX family)
MPKSLSSCVLIFNNNHILGCQAWGNRRAGYDLPKGKIESGESKLDAVIRECKEETNIDLDINQLRYLGKYGYKKDKDLEVYITNQYVDITKCLCIHTFEYLGILRPEMIGYKWISLDNISEFYPKLSKVIDKVLGDINGV